MTAKVPLSTLTRATPKVHVRLGRALEFATPRFAPPDPTPPRGGRIHHDATGRIVDDTRPRNPQARREMSAAAAADVLLLDIELPELGAEQIRAVRQFAEQLPVILIDSQHEHFAQRARSLLQAYPLPDPLGDAHLENYRDELLARQRYLQSVPCWTSKDVADAARHANKNAAQTAYRWKSEGKIFSIPAAGKRDVYPAFQFKDGKPREVMAQILERLNAQRTPWEIAQWFIAPNGWLDGDRPVDLLDDADATDDLLDAAEQEVAANVG